VGIDGYSSNSVEQLGTEQDTSRTGATSYYAWWEMYPNPSVQISTLTISPGDSITASVTYSSGAYTLYLKDNTTPGQQPFSITQTATAQRSSAEWIVEAPSSFFGVLPLANFGTATISGAQATINGTTGAIDNATWQNTSINMVTNSGAVIDQTSGLTDTTTSPITSSFSVTYSGSGGGGGHGHGHGPIATLEVVGPLQSNVQALAAPEAIPDLKVVPLAASAGAKPGRKTVPLAAQNGFVSAPPAHTFVSQIQVHESASGLKTWRIS
jgi:hypothetical protein